MYDYIPISYLNDFMFCPRSIYFHQLYESFERGLYHGVYQINGINAHKAIDNKKYSTKKSILQSMSVYSEKYNLCGKIDIFEIETGKLRERKNKINKVYDGYVFQVYAYYYCLCEMGYDVRSISLYDVSRNKTFLVSLPEDDFDMKNKFENLMLSINNYNMFCDDFEVNDAKCSRCIYRNLCDVSPC